MLVEPHRHQTLAMMVCEGWATEDIAQAMCLAPEVVKRYVSGEGPKVFNDVLRGYREKMERLSVERRFRLAEHAEHCYRNIQEALLSNDMKLKTETSWRILNEIAPPPAPETAPGVSLNVSLTRSHQVNHQIVQLGQDLLGEFNNLRELDTASYQRHLKTGGEALPTAFRAVIDEDNPDLAPDDDENEDADVTEGFPTTKRSA